MPKRKRKNNAKIVIVVVLLALSLPLLLFLSRYVGMGAHFMLARALTFTRDLHRGEPKQSHEKISMMDRRDQSMSSPEIDFQFYATLPSTKLLEDKSDVRSDELEKDVLHQLKHKHRERVRDE